MDSSCAWPECYGCRQANNPQGKENFPLQSPRSRLPTCYNKKKMPGVPPDIFHEPVVEPLVLFQACIQFLFNGTADIHSLVRIEHSNF